MDNHYVQAILGYLNSHPHAGELFTFLVAFCESLPLIGTIVPGTITMTVIGILMGEGALPIFSTLLIATIAAFIGDCGGFAIGYYYHNGLRKVWPFRTHPHWLTKGEDFFKRHGGKSIIMGRFIGPARSTVPMIAGLLQMTWLRFCIAALPSAALWAIMYTTPGMLLGALAREVPKGETTRFLLYGIAIIVAVWLVFWLIQHFFIQLARGINHLTDRSWHYLSRKKRGHFFIRLITNQQNPADHHQLTLALLGVLSGILLLYLLIGVMHQGYVTRINYPVFHLLQTLRTLPLDKLFVIITIMANPKLFIAISVLFTVALVIKKQKRAAIHFFSGFVLSAGAVFIFKKISHSARPQGFQWIQPSSSFPSGHTTLSFVVFGLMAFFMAQIIPKTLRWIPYTISSLFIFLVGFSRLYLGAHWLTDVLGAFLLGLPILLACIIAYRRMPVAKSQLNLKPSMLTALIAVSCVVPWGIALTHSYSEEFNQHVYVWPTQKLTVAQWWRSPLTALPLYRNNRFGEPFQPFNVQWQSSLENITQTLQQHGWKLMLRHTPLKTKLQRFSSYQAQYHLPLLPWLYENKRPVAFFIKHIPKHNRIIELRLWKSGIQIQPGNKPLWIGSTNIRVAPKALMSLKGHAYISLENSGGLKELRNDTKNYTQQSVHATVDKKLRLINQLHWDGKILMIRH